MPDTTTYSNQLSGYINLTETYSTTVDRWNQYKPGDWECEMYGTGRGMIYNPGKDKPIPNWFWRKMQYICFGNKWVKRKN